MRTLGGLVTFLLLGVFVEGAAAIDIDSCGFSIPEKQIGVLTADLSCPGATAVRVGAGATLDLNGHTIDVPGGHGVWCLPAEKCTVTDGTATPGEIRGGQAGIYLQRKARARVSNVVIRDCDVGINAEDWNAGVKGARVQLSGVQVTGSQGVAVHVGSVKATNVVIEDNPGHGIYAGSTSRLKGRGLTVARNATSEGCDLTGCSGIEVGVLSGDDVSVTDNAGLGILAIKAKLRNSTVLENRRNGALRSLVTYERPRLRNVNCDVSFSWEGEFSVHWGVCSIDNFD